LPKREEIIICAGCGCKISSGWLCSSCAYKHEQEKKEWEKKENKAKRDFDRLLNKL
jgi:hypothetical protein